MEAALVVILAASALVGFGVGRWWTPALPVAAVGVFYAGLNVGWWGTGVGDAWQIAMVLVMAAGVLAAVVGVASRKLLRPPRSEDSREGTVRR